VIPTKLILPARETTTAVRLLVFTVPVSVTATTMGTSMKIPRRKSTPVLVTTSIIRDTKEPKHNSRNLQLFATMFVKTTTAHTPSTRKKTVSLKRLTNIRGKLPPSTLQVFWMTLRCKKSSKKMDHWTLTQTT